MGDVTREHFSFSPRMPVGDFYEMRDTPEVSGAMPLLREFCRVACSRMLLGNVSNDWYDMYDCGENVHGNLI